MNADGSRFVMQVQATPLDCDDVILDEPRPCISEAVVTVSGPAEMILAQIARARSGKAVRRERLPWMSLECHFPLGYDELEIHAPDGEPIPVEPADGGLRFEQDGSEYVLYAPRLHVAGSDVKLCASVLGEIARFELSNYAPPRPHPVVVS